MNNFYSVNSKVGMCRILLFQYPAGTGYPAGYCYNYEISQTRLNKLYLAKIIIASINEKFTLDLLENKRFS